jgi:microcystin-dependent protein
MISIVTQPPLLNFSRNPVRYTISTSTPMATVGFYISVSIFFNNSATPVLQLPLMPDNVGRASIDVRAIIDSLLEYELPGRAAVIRKITRQRGLLKLRFSEVTKLVPVDAHPVTTNEVIVIKGGMAYQIWQPTFFTAYVNPHKFYFSWWPSGREVAPWQKLYLNYLHTTATVSDCDLHAIVQYNDGSSKSKTLDIVPAGTLEQYKLYRLPTGFFDLGLDALDTENVPTSYEVFLRDGDGATVYTPYHYSLNHRMDYEKVVLSFFSSLGNMETLRITGEVDASEDRENTSAELYVSGATNYKIPPSVVVASVNMRETYKGNIGYCDLRSVQELRRDLFYSLQAYWIINGRFWPIEILNKNVDRGRLSGQIHDMPVEWAFGYYNGNFTPNDVLMPISLLAVDDVYSLYKNSWLSIEAPGVMANDEDEDPDGLSVVPGTFTSENGVLNLYADGSFTYYPNEGFVGTDTFTYTLLNELGQSDTATITLIVKEMEKGFIVMWSGELADIPAGWALCDGTNGTPNLKGKFIVGLDVDDPDYDTIGNDGGEKEHTLTVEELPVFTIEIKGLKKGADDGDNVVGSENGDKIQVSEPIGGDQPHENRPPFYTLAYIMKL